MEIEDIVQIVKEEVEALSGKEIRDNDENVFFKSNIIDSLNMLHIILFLEQKFSVKIDLFFTNRESISSINKIAKYIKARTEDSIDGHY